MQSARCDKTLSNWWQHKRNVNFAESVALMDISCEYIDSMRMGKYDTEGNVIMDANRLYNEDGAQGINGNLYVQEYGQGLAEVSPMLLYVRCFKLYVRYCQKYYCCHDGGRGYCHVETASLNIAWTK